MSASSFFFLFGLPIGNCIGVEGAKAVAAALEKNSTLTGAYLSGMFCIRREIIDCFSQTQGNSIR